MSFDDIAKYIADKLLSLIEPRLEAQSNRFLKHNVRLTFSTPEAAAMLGVCRQRWKGFATKGGSTFANTNVRRIIF